MTSSPVPIGFFLPWLRILVEWPEAGDVISAWELHLICWQSEYLMHFELMLPFWPTPLQILGIGVFAFYTVVTVS